jgi:hypothetical protein
VKRHIVSKNGTNIRGFHYKVEAIAYAIPLMGHGNDPVITSTRTGRLTYLLPRDKQSCRVCGNELNGKKHCSFCGGLHHYL